MAGGMDLGSGGKSKKKPLDTAINLVPFIDLMAVTISFLIMTAVWTQIGRLQVSSAGNGADPTTKPEDDKRVPLTLLLSDKELRLTVGTVALPPILVTHDAKGTIELAALKESFKKVKGELRDQDQITVQTEDSVRYDDLVRVIDECIGDEFPNVSVSPVTT